MSSILKALRRLEDDVIKKRKVRYLQEKGVSTRDVIEKKVKTNWLLNRLLLIIVSGTFVIITTWIFFNNDSVTHSSGDAGVSNTTHTPGDVTTGVYLPPEDPEPAENDPADPVVDDSNNGTNKSAMKSLIPPLPSDAGLNLTALVWNTDPHKRFVIINTENLRAGWTIEGYTVDRITKEGVILTADGKSWLLK